MHHVSRVAVEGFWDTYDFELQLFPKVTFLIGQNGTGKTTLINLIAAALTGDIRTLYRIPFKRIFITLDERTGDLNPTITVTKKNNTDKGVETIEYDLNSSMLKHTFSTVSSPETMLIRRPVADHRRYVDVHRTALNDLAEKIHTLVEVNWISVNRMPVLERPPEDRNLESTVDIKLDNISNNLVRFLSTLSKKKDDEVRNFQEFLFISLIEQHAGKVIFDLTPLATLDKDVDALTGIFKELNVDQERVTPLLEKFRNAGTKIKASSERGKKTGPPPLTVNDAAFLLGLKRVSDVVERWHTLQNKLAEIFKPREKLLAICNELLQRKKMEISPSNELQFKSRTGKPLTAMQLSSGEKQLLILLIETLLQQDKPAILIADEPELSLHVLWQERLVESLLALNPSVQIIAATHSPDIVGRLADRAIDMESVIQ
jgi:predicted ATP-binding protein involved in virulence